jgi:hypothetical protein
MPLAAVTDLTVFRRRRVNEGSNMAFYADIAWFNAETQNHFVEVTLSPGTKFTLPRGARSLRTINMSRFSAAEATTSKTVLVEVVLKSATEESSATSQDVTFSLSDSATFSPLSYNAATGEINLPMQTGGTVEVLQTSARRIFATDKSTETPFVYDLTWSYGSIAFRALGASSIINQGRVESFPGLGSTLVSRLPSILATDIIQTRSIVPGEIGRTSGQSQFLFYNAPDLFIETERGVKIQRTSTGGPSLGSSTLASRFDAQGWASGLKIAFEALNDGGFYAVDVTLRSPKVPDRVDGRWVNSTTSTSSTVAFEYYSRGTPPVIAPVITGATSASALVGLPFNYQITARNNPTSFNATSLPASLTVNTATGAISGVIDSAGTTSSTISATNSAGTGSAALSIVASAPVPIFTSPLTAETFVDTAFEYRAQTDDSTAAIEVNFGSASGLFYNSDTQVITGSVDTEGMFDISLTATNSFGVTNKTLVLNVRPFTAFGGSITSVRNSRVRAPLSASHRATWSIASGAPSGFSIEYVPPNFGTASGPDAAFLVGTPLTSGSFGINLTATRAGTQQTSTALFTLAVTDAPPAPTVISGNADVIRNGLNVTRGSNISLAFVAAPSPAVWQVVGLPPGLSFDGNGLISGAVSEIGVYSITLSATAEGFATGTIGLRINVSEPPVPPPPPPPPTGSTPETRSPWLLQQWELTDLSVYARTRVVQSTAFESGALRLKLGDNVTFAILFVDQGNAVFAMAPSQLRITIRRADNLDDLIIFKSGTPPASATTQSQTYYLLPVTTGNREREVALEWAEENGKNEPLQCVADIDWVKDGKTYSSRSFPVLLELDVTRP